MTFGSSCDFTACPGGRKKKNKKMHFFCKKMLTIPPRGGIIKPTPQGGQTKQKTTTTKTNMKKNALDLAWALEVMRDLDEDGIAWAYRPTDAERETNGWWDTEWIPAYKCAGPGVCFPFWRASRELAWEPGWWVAPDGYLYCGAAGEEI